MKAGLALVVFTALGLMTGSTVASAQAGPQRSPRVESRLSILQGATDTTRTQIAIQAPKGMRVRVALEAVAGTGDRRVSRQFLPNALRVTTRPYAQTQIVSAAWGNLEPGREYQLRIFHVDTGALLDQRTLSTLTPGQPTARVALVSCMHDRFAEAGAPLWESLLEKKPDLVLFLGDNVYTDERGRPADERALWLRHEQTRARLRIFKAHRLIPSLATWDDHDYGANDADQRYPLKNQAREIFDVFFPRDAGIAVERGPGVAAAARLFGHTFVLMDNRSFRNETDSQGNPTHWGLRQTQWLFETLPRDGSPVWLISGSQFFGGHTNFESFEREHAADFRRLLKNLSRLPSPVLFVGGDRHQSELMRIQDADLGYETFELTSSSMHSFAARPDQPIDPNPRRIEGPYRRFNYMIVDTTTALPQRMRAGVPWRLQVRVFGPENALGFSRAIEIRR